MRLIDADKIIFREIDEIGGEYEPYLGCSKSQIDSLPTVTPQLSSGLEKNSKKLEKDFGESDCISRADAIRVASGYCHPSNVAKELANLPSVTPQEPKTGHWIDCDNSDDYSADGYDCSVCGVNAEYATSYCPNCGARMVEPQESEG